MGETRNSRIISASAEKLYDAITTPSAIEIWQVPGNMRGKIHNFNLEEEGGYEMSLFYPGDEDGVTGKTGEKEDRFKATFAVLSPPYKIVEHIVFESDDPAFSGIMTMEISLKPVGEATEVTFHFTNIPDGINPKDNEAGTLSSLEKLASYVE